MTSVTTLYDDSPFPCFPDGRLLKEDAAVDILLGE